MHQGFPGGSYGKESACSAGDLGLIPGLGRSPEGGMATPVLRGNALQVVKVCIHWGGWRAETVYQLVLQLQVEEAFTPYQALDMLIFFSL